MWIVVAWSNRSQGTCTVCGQLTGAFGSKRGGVRGVAPTPETHVKCPDCKELVRKEARVCKHCGCKLIPQ